MIIHNSHLALLYNCWLFFIITELLTSVVVTYAQEILKDQKRGNFYFIFQKLFGVE
jgi:hypothetical protein